MRLNIPNPYLLCTTIQALFKLEKDPAKSGASNADKTKEESSESLLAEEKPKTIKLVGYAVVDHYRIYEKQKDGRFVKGVVHHISYADADGHVPEDVKRAFSTKVTNTFYDIDRVAIRPPGAKKDDIDLTLDGESIIVTEIGPHKGDSTIKTGFSSLDDKVRVEGKPAIATVADEASQAHILQMPCTLAGEGKTADAKPAEPSNLVIIPTYNTPLNARQLKLASLFPGQRASALAYEDWLLMQGIEKIAAMDDTESSLPFFNPRTAQPAARAMDKGFTKLIEQQERAEGKLAPGREH